MARYIDMNELLNAIDKRNGRLPLWLDEILVQDCKVADVAPVVHGHWILEREPNGKPYCFHCSACDEEFRRINIYTKYNYCPDCGAKMDEEV